MGDRSLEITGIAGLLALLVNGRGDAFPDLLAGNRVIRRRESAQAVIRALGLGKVLEIELRMSDNRPGDSRKFGPDGRLLGHDRFPDRDRQVELVLLEQILGHRCQHGT